MNQLMKIQFMDWLLDEVMIGGSEHWTGLGQFTPEGESLEQAGAIVKLASPSLSLPPAKLPSQRQFGAELCASRGRLGEALLNRFSKSPFLTSESMAISRSLGNLPELEEDPQMAYLVRDLDFSRGKLFEDKVLRNLCCCSSLVVSLAGSFFLLAVFWRYTLSQRISWVLLSTVA